MKAYSMALNDGDTTMVLSPDSAFFNFLMILMNKVDLTFMSFDLGLIPLIFFFFIGFYI